MDTKETSSYPRTVACQAPLSMGLSWQEYWSGLPFPSPGNLPDPGIREWTFRGQLFYLPQQLSLIQEDGKAMAETV